MLQPLQPGQDSRQTWRQVNALDAVLSADLQGLRQQVVETHRGAWDDDRFHPFRVYALPPRLRSTTAAEDWRKVRVRAGRVMSIDVTGTDGHNENPDEPTYLTEEDVTDITVPAATAEYWVWIHITRDGSNNVTAAEVRHAAASGLASQDWTAGPVPTANQIPIAKIDTNTNAADTTLVIRQYLRTDVFFF